MEQPIHDATKFDEYFYLLVGMYKQLFTCLIYKCKIVNVGRYPQFRGNGNVRYIKNLIDDLTKRHKLQK